MVEFKGEQVTLYDDERAEPLGGGYYIIQSDSWYRFGSDAVALAHFASKKMKRTDRVVELCSGCGVISVMLAADVGCGVTGVELDGKLFGMSERSRRLNGLADIEFVNGDVRGFSGTYDAVVCNPPFFKAGSKKTALCPHCNQELTVTAADIISAAKRCLKVGGALYLVYTATRLDEMFALCRENGLTPKELVVNPNGKTFLLRAVRGGKLGMTVRVGDS